MVRHRSLNGYAQRPLYVKQLFTAAKIFAFLMLLFVPSVLVMAVVYYLATDPTRMFYGAFGTAVFLGNLAYMLTGDRRAWLWRKLNAISGINTLR
jgi:carbon starvation protein CstA